MKSRREEYLEGLLKKIADALGTNETGDNLVKVAAAAHLAERELAGKNKKFRSVTATPCPAGINMPCSQYAETLEITDDLPSSVIGECVARATHNAWKAGHDPALEPFLLLVQFGSGR
jgi:hypothetical protein